MSGQLVIVTSQKRKTALVLSGGGALGAAHIGVVKILEKQGYEFDFYSGVSAGSIIISLLAVGYSADEIWEIVEKTNIFSTMFDISKSRFGLIQGDKIIKLFVNIWETRKLRIQKSLWLLEQQTFPMVKG